LEILDPEQNSSFVDHYLDVPVDLSKVLFVCTANEEHAIHPALKDRMEFIKLSGYVHEEKVEIAKKYLVPEVRSECGIKEDQVTVDSSALDSLIKWYCRESGVRNLKKHIEKIFRKAALKIVQKGEEKILVTKENLKDYVGHPSSDYDKVFETTPPGVTLGLGFNAIYGNPMCF
jgi:Lon-like ATP-dependent protease